MKNIKNYNKFISESKHKEDMTLKKATKILSARMKTPAFWYKIFNSKK